MSTLAELNRHLFAALDRLDVQSLTPEQIEAEVSRTGAIVDLADRVTENAKVQLTAAKLFVEHGAQIVPHLPMIGNAQKAADK